MSKQKLKVGIMAHSISESKYWLDYLYHNQMKEDGGLIRRTHNVLVFENVKYQALFRDDRSKGIDVDQILLCGSLYYCDPYVEDRLLRLSCVPKEYQVQYMELD